MIVEAQNSHLKWLQHFLATFDKLSSWEKKNTGSLVFSKAFVQIARKLRTHQSKLKQLTRALHDDHDFFKSSRSRKQQKLKTIEKVTDEIPKGRKSSVKKRRVEEYTDPVYSRQRRDDFGGNFC
jgi:hypothetical protein